MSKSDSLRGACISLELATVQYSTVQRSMHQSGAGHSTVQYSTVQRSMHQSGAGYSAPWRMAGTRGGAACQPRDTGRCHVSRVTSLGRMGRAPHQKHSLCLLATVSTSDTIQPSSRYSITVDISPTWKPCSMSALYSTLLTVQSSPSPST